MRGRVGRMIAASAAAGLLALAGTPGARAQDETGAKLQAAAAWRAMGAGDCPAVVEGAERMLAAPDVGQVYPSMWLLAVSSGAQCAVRLERMDEAERLTGLLLARDEAASFLEPPLAGAFAGIIAEAAQSVRTAPFALALIGKAETARKAGKGGHAVAMGANMAFVDHAAALTLTGRTDDARALIATIGAPKQRLFIAIDSRFAPLWSSPEAAAAEIVALTQVAAEREPDVGISMPGALAWPLLALGRNDEALALSLRLLGPRPEGFGTYVDAGDERYALTLALIALGRIDEAWSIARVHPTAGDTHEAARVAAVVLALVRADRPDDARSLLLEWRKVRRPYGESDLPDLAACIDTRLGQPAAGQAAPDGYLDLDTQLSAKLCAGREDDTAAFVIHMLESTGRDGMLAALQHYRAPKLLGAFDAELRRRRLALLARPDVGAAVARQGRILDLELYRAPFN